jgi:hypothetical protein
VITGNSMNIKENVTHDRKPADCYSGHENLQVFFTKPCFNDWIYEQILPGLKGNVLEIEE